MLRRPALKFIKPIFYVFLILLYQTSSAAAQTVDVKPFLWPFYDPNSGSCGDTSATTSASPGGKVYLLGDSILEGSYYITGYLKQDLDNNSWDSTADASAGRSLTTPGSDPSNHRQGHEQSGLDAIDTDADIIKNAGRVVIELGTNTSGSASQFGDQMKQAIRKVKNLNDSAKIYWVNIVSTSNSIYPSYNRTIENVADSQSITVIDAKSKNIALGGDNTHPTTAGYKKYSQVISDALGPAGGTNAGGAPSSGVCCSVGQGDSVLTGSDREQKTWNYFKAKGLSDAQVAGIMGNMAQESHFDPEIMQIGGRSRDPYDAGTLGWGIIQWSGNSEQTGDKVTRLFKQSGLTGQIYELSTQLNLVWGHMHNNPPITRGDFNISDFKKITDEKEATRYFLAHIEAGTDPINPRTGKPVREEYATNILHKYGGSGGASGISSESGGSCGSASSSPDCQAATGNAKILCEAKKYQGNYYRLGAGHDGYKPFKDRCPADKAESVAAKSTASDPGPCATDCSSLVSIALDDAFGKDYMWSVQDGSMQGPGANNWERVSISQAKAGDIVTTSEHVEIVDRVSGNTVYTFGSHHTGTKTGPEQVTSYYTAAYRWTGPGSS